MTPSALPFYQEWSSLNYMYGVTNISYAEKENLVAHLEFEPGLYTNHQMKVTRGSVYSEQIFYISFCTCYLISACF